MIKTFKSDLYPFIFIVSLGETIENIHAFGIKKYSALRKESQAILDDLKEQENAYAFCLQNGGYVFICMPKFENNAEWNSVLAHEISHATFFTLDRCGVALSSPYEAYCYWNGWITKQIYSLIGKDISKKVSS